MSALYFAVACALLGLASNVVALRALRRQTRILFDDVERLQDEWIKAGPNANHRDEEVERLKYELECVQLTRAELCMRIHGGTLKTWLPPSHRLLVEVEAAPAVVVDHEKRIAQEIADLHFEPVPPPRVKKPRKPKPEEVSQAVEKTVDFINGATRPPLSSAEFDPLFETKQEHSPKQTELEAAISGAAS